MKLKHFKDSEFACPCGNCGLNIKDMNHKFLQMLDTARDKAETPFVLNSTIRCKEHNDSLSNSSPTSAHLKGMASDIKCTSSRTRFKIIASLLEVGFNRIGIGKSFIHADIDPTKDNDVVWLY